MTADTEQAILAEMRLMRVQIETLMATLARRRSQHVALTAAARLSGRTVDEVRNAILRKVLPAVPCTAKGGKKSFKILRADLAVWMQKQVA